MKISDLAKFVIMLMMVFNQKQTFNTVKFTYLYEKKHVKTKTKQK